MTNYLFTMADMESHADFARKRGSKDKSKRKSRGMLATAGIAGGGLAGAAALGAGARYGGAELSTRMAQRRLYNGAGGTGLQGQKMRVNTGRNAVSGGAKGAFDRDKAYLMSAPGRLKNSAGRAKAGLTTGAGIGGLKGAAARLGNTWKSGMVGKAGMLGAGALGVGAVGGAGYAGYRALKNRKKKR